MRIFWMRFMLLAVLITAACAPSATTEPSTPLPPPPPTADFETPLPPTDDVAPPTLGSTPTGESFTPEPPPPAISAETANLPAWRTLPLTDVRTGESFTLADFSDKVVYVHPMALWCTTCRAHLRSMRDSVLPVLESPEDVVFVTLAIEPQTTSDALLQYADNESFNWTFAVVTPEMLTELVAYFGQSVAVPPSTPHFLIRPDGRDTGLLTGSPSPQQDLELINMARSA